MRIRTRSRNVAPRSARSFRSAADFAGADAGLREIFVAMSRADDERDFDQAFEMLVVSLSENTARYLQTS